MNDEPDPRLPTPTDRPPRNYAEQRGLLEDSLSNIPPNLAGPSLEVVAATRDLAWFATAAGWSAILAGAVLVFAGVLLDEPVAAGLAYAFGAATFVAGVVLAIFAAVPPPSDS